jgi:hypothetical protein
MHGVFTELANRLGLTLQVGRGFDPATDIFFEVHSKFPDELLSIDFRGLHLIRDPRDVVLSATRYHLDSTEKWLHVPDGRFGGLTYQQRIGGLEPRDQFLFEMQGMSNLTIRGMAAWRYDDPRFFEARYEDLIEDQGPDLFAAVLSFLGFDGLETEAGVEIFRRWSMAGKQIPSGHPHIRSAAKQQWKTAYRRWHGERFIDAFGDCLIVLGYEADHSWVNDLPP